MTSLQFLCSGARPFPAWHARILAAIASSAALAACGVDTMAGAAAGGASEAEAAKQALAQKQQVDAQVEAARQAVAKRTDTINEATDPAAR